MGLHLEADATQELESGHPSRLALSGGAVCAALEQQRALLHRQGRLPLVAGEMHLELVHGHVGAAVVLQALLKRGSKSPDRHETI